MCVEESPGSFLLHSISVGVPERDLLCVHIDSGDVSGTGEINHTSNGSKFICGGNVFFSTSTQSRQKRRLNQIVGPSPEPRIRA